jgi:hypothetical protein
MDILYLKEYLFPPVYLLYQTLAEAPWIVVKETLKFLLGENGICHSMLKKIISHYSTRISLTGTNRN